MPKAKITCNTVGAQIRYTIDGSNVTEQSTLYEGGGDIELSYGTPLKAKSYKFAMNPSNQIMAQSFTKCRKPSISTINNGTTVTINVSLSNAEQTCVYKIGSAPQNETDGTLLTGDTNKRTFTVEKGEENIVVYVRVFHYGKENPSDATNVVINKYYPPLTIPTVLPDGSVLFYDRGESYGDYEIGSDGYPRRITVTIDDETAESQNWRYLICNKSDLSEKYTLGTLPSSLKISQIGTGFGYGLSNTNLRISADESNYHAWYIIALTRQTTSEKWFLPSKDELNILYENKNIIIQNGGENFESDYYWSSSISGAIKGWCQNFADGSYMEDSMNSTADSHFCRLIRRI